jgi:nanoRNase/pAp phosphatase (c-di-AMP/oligoRNAs hydrolase)
VADQNYAAAISDSITGFWQSASAAFILAMLFWLKRHSFDNPTIHLAKKFSVTMAEYSSCIVMDYEEITLVAEAHDL